MAVGSKGNMAEGALLNAFVQRGFEVLVPFGEGQPYDLAVDLSEGRFLRVQCKSSRRSANGGCIEFNSRSTDHGRAACRTAD